MASQDTPVNTSDTSLLSVSTTAVNGSFGTPLSRVSDISGCMDVCTPTHTPIRNPAVEKLRRGVDKKSPMLKIPASPIMQRLGYGTGVGVYLLERSPMVCGDLRSPWAIKKTHKVSDTTLDDSQEVFAERIIYEAEILKKLSHPNIIGYRAFGQTSPGDTYLAMEKASQSLADLIEERVDDVMIVNDCDEAAPFPADKIEKVTMDVAKALTYLHDEVRFVHGDLKSANVLVFGDFDLIKLCDFGVARRLSENGIVEGSYVGTEIWCGMEVILAKRGQEHSPITHKADIFPFGLTIHEMITLKPPHLSSAEDSYLGSENSSFNNTDNSKVSVTSDNGNDTTGDDSFDEGAYEDALSRYVGTRPPLPDMDFDPTYSTILGIFYCCTEEDPSKRPDAKDIVAALIQLTKNQTN